MCRESPGTGQVSEVVSKWTCHIPHDPLPVGMVLTWPVAVPWSDVCSPEIPIIVYQFQAKDGVRLEGVWLWKASQRRVRAPFHKRRDRGLYYHTVGFHTPF